MPVIETKNLVKTFMMGEQEIHAVRGISLTIEKNEFVAITGASGSGKSTFMHLLGCLDAPTSGEYFLDGQNVAHFTSDELAQIRNQKIGFIFQKFNLLPDLTATNNVALPLLYAGMQEQEAIEKAREMLNQVGLGDRCDHSPYQLSGGQQQRVAIARSLINNPSIVFADEPTGNLDSATGLSIMEIFQKLHEEQEVTIILVTHEPPIAAYTKRVLRLMDGTIESDIKQ